jgi:hypothetical protein
VLLVNPFSSFRTFLPGYGKPAKPFTGQECVLDRQAHWLLEQFANRRLTITASEDMLCVGGQGFS